MASAKTIKMSVKTAGGTELTVELDGISCWDSEKEFEPLLQSLADKMCLLIQEKFKK